MGKHESINDVLNAGMSAEQIGKVLHDSDVKALSDWAITEACSESLDRMVGHPDATVARMYPLDHVRAIHKFGFWDGGAMASERGAAVLEVLLRASERCLKHFDKIRPEDKEPSAMVEELRKAIKICRGY